MGARASRRVLLSSRRSASVRSPISMPRIIAVVALVCAGIGTAWGQNASRPGEPPVVGGLSIDSKASARLPLLTLHSPATAAGFSRIERYLLTESALRGRGAALLTLVTAREMNLPYEWSVREGAARASGLEGAVIEV